MFMSEWNWMAYNFKYELQIDLLPPHTIEFHNTRPEFENKTLAYW